MNKGITKNDVAIMINDIISFVEGLGFSVQIVEDDDKIYELVVYDTPDGSFGAVAWTDEEGKISD